MEILNCRNIYAKYNKRNYVLENINFKINRGNILAILGHNGAGKTTLIKCILGFIQPSKGEILKNYSNVGVVIDKDTFYINETVYYNLKQTSLIKKVDEMQIFKWMEFFKLSNKKNEKVKNLSKGMQKKLQLCMALLNDPELLIFDEFTNNLDVYSIIEIRNYLKEINQSTLTTIIIADHNIAELEKLSTHFLFLKNGKQIIFDTSVSLLNKNIKISNKYLLKTCKK